MKVAGAARKTQYDSPVAPRFRIKDRRFELEGGGGTISIALISNGTRSCCNYSKLEEKRPHICGLGRGGERRGGGGGDTQ